MAEEDKDLELKADVGTGPGCLRTTILGGGIALLAIVVLLALTSLEKVNTWEVGLRYWNFPVWGLIERDQPQTLEPGYNLIIPKLHEFVKYDCSLQRFEMAPAFPNMPKPDLPPLKVRTAKDQDEIDVYVTILYRVNRENADQLRKHYSDESAVRDKGIAAKCPDILQAYLGEIMTANQFYSMTRDKRQEIYEKRKELPNYLKDRYPSEEYLYDRSTQAVKAMEQMNMFFGIQGGGVEVEAVLIWDFKFKDEIEGSIISKVIADEKVEMETAMKDAAEQKAEWLRLSAEADAAFEAELARGTAESRKIQAEAQQYQVEKYAQGDKLILEAQAEGKGKLNQALAGAGGRTYVGLEYAKALQGLDLIILPAGGNEGLNPLNIDQTVRKISPGPRSASTGETTQ